MPQLALPTLHSAPCTHPMLWTGRLGRKAMARRKAASAAVKLKLSGRLHEDNVGCACQAQTAFKSCRAQGAGRRRLGDRRWPRV